jgi:hypothetical protein
MSGESYATLAGLFGGEAGAASADGHSATSAPADAGADVPGGPVAAAQAAEVAAAAYPTADAVDGSES